jgi:CheY-like chemotaxis protein
VNGSDRRVEVLRQVRADERLKTLPVVILSSSKKDRDIAESYRLGANSYVSKPVEFGEFADAVAKLGLYWLLVNKPPYQHAS